MVSILYQEVYDLAQGCLINNTLLNRGLTKMLIKTKQAAPCRDVLGRLRQNERAMTSCWHTHRYQGYSGYCWHVPGWGCGGWHCETERKTTWSRWCFDDPGHWLDTGTVCMTLSVKKFPETVVKYSSRFSFITLEKNFLASKVAIKFTECLFTLSANSPPCWQRLFTLTLPTNVWLR